MNNLKSKLDSVNCEIASLDLEKREKKFFLSLDILKHNFTLLNNLNDELGKISGIKFNLSNFSNKENCQKLIGLKLNKSQF
jgi:hypothetical protein